MIRLTHGTPAEHSDNFDLDFNVYTSDIIQLCDFETLKVVHHMTTVDVLPRTCPLAQTRTPSVTPVLAPSLSEATTQQRA